jgi:hypothetical protein
MACDCIERKEVELQKQVDDPEAFISAILDFKTNMRRFNAKCFYRKKIKNPIKDFFMKNFSVTFIPFEYCPFCGKKYIEEVNHG